MATILLILQIFIVLALVAVILIQKTGNDGLSGLSGGGHNFISNSASGNLFTKLTMFLAIAFMVNSLALAKIVVNEKKELRSIIDTISEDYQNNAASHNKDNKAPAAPIAK